jgi:hypothetical protein
VAAAVAAAVVPLPAAAVDRWYSAGVYATLQPWLTSLSNLITFSLLDLLLVGVAILWVVRAVRELLHTPSRGRGALIIVARTIVWAAALYLLFLALWGLNYRRPRLRDSGPYEASAVTADAAAAALRQAVNRLNGLYDRAHVAGWSAPGEVDEIGTPLRKRYGGGHRARRRPGAAKHTLLDWYFRRAGVDRMTDPSSSKP